MKILFVTRIKEKDLKKVAPWAKKIVPVMGGFVCLDTPKMVGLQKELVSMAKKEFQIMQAQEKRRAAWEKKLKSGAIPLTLPRRRRKA